MECGKRSWIFSVSKICCKYKQNGKVIKGKHKGRPGKTSKHQDRKLPWKQKMHNETNEKQMA